VRNALCFALFSTPESALAAALEIQSSLCRRSPAAEGTEEWGYVPVSRDGAQLLFQAVSACYEKRSMIITTNLEFGRWVNIFLDQTMTTALIDRLVHYSHLLIFDGESHRVKTSLMRR
jgi:hypothetical protein